MAGPTLWLFEDQLSPTLATLADHPDAPIFMVESDVAFRFVPYHKKRLTFLIAAMRHFAADLRAAGRTVHYYPLQPDGYRDSLAALRHSIETTGQRSFVVVDPSEHRTRAWLDTLPAKLGIELTVVPNTLFLIKRDGFATWVNAHRPSPTMETFYRLMRRKHRVLMDGHEPAGGRWNFDRQNRRAAAGSLLMPPPPSFPPDAITRQVMAEVDRRFTGHPGETAGFDYPVTRTDAVAVLADFVARKLPFFGDVQDAMLSDHRLLYHSQLSSLMNAGLLGPMEAIVAAEAAYRNGAAPIHAVEGFVRQILGWREWVYGLYHTYMPAYRTRNARGSTRPLPPFFWTGETDLNCLQHTIGTVLSHAYSHHIQRLMVICNFATLAGLNPQAVNDWFLAMYVDSHDWVVTPNVIGMAMNADGGTAATKPYVSSAAYIDRMSDYCGGCRYDPKQRVGPAACPFNYLYWTFVDDERAAMAANARVGGVLRHLDVIPPAELAAMHAERTRFLGAPA